MMENLKTMRFRTARDSGCSFLLGWQHTDGSVGRPKRGLADYYKVLLSFQACGETRAASRLCTWIRGKGILPNGDFGPRPQEAFGYPYCYFNCWVILGATRLGHYDLAQRGIKFLLGSWDPESGGFYSSPTERTPKTKQDLWVVAACGLAALATGKLDVAHSVGCWMRRLMELQPDDYPRRMYPVFSQARGLHTAPDPDEDDIRYVLSNDALRDQFFFIPGIAAGFLVRLFQATGEQEWLHLARQYMLFVEGANEYLFSLLRAGKVGWAAALLYTLTGDQKFRALAVRVGNMLVEAQGQDGAWAGETDDVIDFTAEMVVWLDEIYQAVGETT